jgi:hypothetical protein
VPPAGVGLPLTKVSPTNFGKIGSDPIE